MKNKCGFTLVEVLITVSLVALVSLAIYGLFDSGIRVMKKVFQPVSQEKIHFFLEKVSHDVQNLFPYAGIPFKGDTNTVEFATTIAADDELGGGEGIGRVSYTYDPSEEAVYRQQLNISEVFATKEDDEIDVNLVEVLNQVTSWSVRYYSYEPGTRSYVWEESWDEIEQNKGMIPVAVKFEFSFVEEGEEFNVTRTITIPATK